MNKIYADVEKRKYTTDYQLALAYKRKTGRSIIALSPTKIKYEDVAPIPVESKGDKVYVIVSRTKHETILGIPAQLEQWINYGFDLRPFDDHRQSLDGTQALFRNFVKGQAGVDKLNAWKSNGVIVDWYYYYHQEYDGDGNPTDTTIKDFLSGNTDWESDMEV